MKKSTTSTTLSPAPQHYYFFGAIFSMTFLILLAMVPIFAADQVTWGVGIGLLLAIVVFSSLACYAWIFVSKRPVRATIIEFSLLLVVMHPFVFGIHHWDPLSNTSKLIVTAHWWENINLIFSVVVLLVSMTTSYCIALKKSSNERLQTGADLAWTLFNIDLQKRTYGRRVNFPIIHIVYWPLALLGVVYVTWFSMVYKNHPSLGSDLQLIVIFGLCAMILCYLAGLVFGESIRLMQIEREFTQGQFYIANHVLLLKWRHDYVKYHLPAPIRALNLRLFNQHIEAYERHLREQNSQSRPKGAGQSLSNKL